MENLPAIVLTFVIAGIIILGAFAHKASHDGADKAAFRLLWYASPVLLGTIAALIVWLEWI